MSQLDKAVQAVAKAEELIVQDQNNPNLSFNKTFLDKAEKVYNELLKYGGLTASEVFANKYQYVTRYLQETLFIAGRIRI